MTQFYCNKIIDISLPLNQNTIIYPGNPHIEIESLTSKSGSRLSKLTLGSHSGTHVDAPSHVLENGPPIDDYPLSSFIGLCKVLDFTHSGERIDTKDLEKKQINKGDRLLLKTNNSRRGFSEFYEDYVYLSGSSASYLAEREIMLLGIDALSVKQRGAVDNSAHTKLLEKGIAVVEGLNLSSVNEGIYFLVVLPLKFTNLDGAPARAVLFS